jgi:ribonuclease Z
MRFEVLILGSNSALPAHGRHPSAQLIIHHNDYFLVDCGEGTQMRMSDMQVKRSKINTILISHLHGDHIFGLPGLLTSYMLNNRQEPLHVIGPAGLYKFLNVTLNLDQAILSFELNIQEIDATISQKIKETPYLEVYAFPLEHRIPTAGYRFIEKNKPRNLIPASIEKYKIPIEDYGDLKKGMDWISPRGEIIPNGLLTEPPSPPRSYAYCSDTAYAPSIIPFIQGFDLIYHEATFLANMEEQAAQRYHSTSQQAAKIALQAKVKHLILGHFSSRYSDLDSLLYEAQLVFPSTELAVEGKVFQI